MIDLEKWHKLCVTLKNPLNDSSYRKARAEIFEGLPELLRWCRAMLNTSEAVLREVKICDKLLNGHLECSLDLALAIAALGDAVKR